jgi:Glu-tRNA(Gln) amidotransferase subunit E-like FAD-binding protein
MNREKNPIKKAFKSIQKIITTRINDDKDSDDQIPKLDSKALEECNQKLQGSNTKLIDMDVKLFQTTQKYEYAKQTQDEFLNNNIKAFIQDLVNENINKETLIQLLIEENEALKKILQDTKIKTTSLDEIDDLIQSVEENLQNIYNTKSNK